MDKLRCVTISLNTDFVSGAKPGDWIDGEAEITRKTRNLVFVSGRLSVEGKTVLNASGIWKILRPKTPA
ncbi:MAG: PaaI family thioesterase [Alphaproteobacteria bacterium]|nr:PaaI family thioesterase [Alphaproteobacteria bacterium]